MLKSLFWFSKIKILTKPSMFENYYVHFKHFFKLEVYDKLNN